MPLPLAFNQERLLVTEEARVLVGFVPTGARFPLVFRIDAPIDRQRLERVVNIILRRHTALRSAYEPNERYDHRDRARQLEAFTRTGLFVPGLYVQRTLSDVSLSVSTHEVGSEDHLTPFVQQQLDTPLDTAHGPLVRATLVSAGSGSRFLVLIFTHYTMDGWSLRLFTREFAALSTDAGVDRTRFAIRSQYHDFALWQLREFRERRFVAEERYWHERWARLGDAQIRSFELPFTRPSYRPAAVSPFATQERLAFTVDETEAVRTLIAHAQCTPYVLFRSVLTMALHYHTRKRRLAFWGNFTNRRNAEFVPTLGWHSNTHIVPVEIDSDMTCVSLCRRVARAVSEAQMHEALPLGALWQRLGRVLDNHTTRVNFDVLPRRQHPAGSSPIEVAILPGMFRGFDLDIRLWENCGTFVLVATFNGQRYAIDGVTALLASMRRIVMRIVENPDLRVSDCESLMATHRYSEVPATAAAGDSGWEPPPGAAGAAAAWVD